MGNVVRTYTRPTERQISNALKQGQESLDKIIAHAENREFDSMDEEAKRLLTIIAHPHFPSQRAKLFIDMVSAAKIRMHIKESQRLLKAVSDASVSGNLAARQEAVNEARLHAARAVKAGANPAISTRIDQIIGILEQTTKPGIDAAAKAEAVRRTTVSAEWTGGKIDRRKAIRISSPRLNVLINGCEAYTGDWSMYGLRIIKISGSFQVGDKVRLRLQAIGMDEPTEMLIARVVRHDAVENILSVEFPAISVQVLKIAKHLKTLGIDMERH